MWVCSFCGMELDDSIESCPFGCGTSRADGKGGEAVAADSGVAMPPLSNADVGARDYGSSNAVPTRENDGVEPRGRLADHRDLAAAQQAPLAKDGKSLLVLTEGRTGKQLRIDSIACVLGREGDYCPELFSEQVSRAHMEISYSDHVWQACHIGTNPSVLVTPNGRINMETGIAYPLHGVESGFAWQTKRLWWLSKSLKKPRKLPCAQKASKSVKRGRKVAETWLRALLNAGASRARNAVRNITFRTAMIACVSVRYASILWTGGI